MTRFAFPILSCVLIPSLFVGSVFAASESEIHEKIVLQGKNDTAEGAAALAGAMQECAAHIATAAKAPVSRRRFELMMCDAQDAVAGMRSPEALKVFANSLGRLAPDAMISVCYALKTGPASEVVDSAALKLLSPQLDFRVRTALIDLLGAHKFLAAFDKIAVGLDPRAVPSVQIATCRAMAALQDKKAVPALIKYMVALPPGQGGRFVYEATGALRTLTGQTIIANPGEWKKWWDKNEKDFAANGPKASDPDYNYELYEKQNLEYYEVPVVENRMVLVLDTSGSMTLGGKPNRLDSAKSSMKNFVKSLGDKVLLNIVAFSNNSRRWKKDMPLVPATEANKKDALKFIDSQVAGGGTQTQMAMEDALREIAVIYGCETIYLVTDGNPTPWDGSVTAEKQGRLMTWINQCLKIRINTIGIYTLAPIDDKLAAGSEDLVKMKKFLEDLAINNDGVYREVGKNGEDKVTKGDPKKEKAMKEKEDKDKAAKEQADKDAAAKPAPEKAEKEKPAEPEKKPAAPKKNAPDAE